MAASKGSDLAAMAFPNKSFDYGGDGTVSEAERKTRAKDMERRWENVKMPEMDSLAHGRKVRNVHKKLNQTDEAVVRGAHNSNGWMRRLLEAHPPSAEISLDQILEKATKIKPNLATSATALWSQVIHHLKMVIEMGHKHNWADDANIPWPILQVASFEMLRIYGDDKLGFGFWPSALTQRLGQAGLGWVRVPAQHRIIPLCWKAYCDDHKIKYKNAVSLHSQTTKGEQETTSPPLGDASTTTSVPSTSSATQTQLPSRAPSRGIHSSEDLTKRAQDLGFKFRGLNDPWIERRGEFQGFGDHATTIDTLNKLKDNLTLLVKTVDKKFQYDGSAFEMVCEATELSTLLIKSFASKIEASLAKIQGETATKGDLQGLIKHTELSQRVDTVLSGHQSDGQTAFGRVNQEVRTLREIISRHETTINGLGHKLHVQREKTARLEINQAKMQSTLEGLQSMIHGLTLPGIDHNAVPSLSLSNANGFGIYVGASSSSNYLLASPNGEMSGLPPAPISGPPNLKRELDLSESHDPKRRKLAPRWADSNPFRAAKNHDSGYAGKSISGNETLTFPIKTEKPNDHDQHRSGLTREADARASAMLPEDIFDLPTSTASDTLSAPVRPDGTSSGTQGKKLERLLPEDPDAEGHIVSSPKNANPPLLSDGYDSMIL